MPPEPLDYQPVPEHELRNRFAVRVAASFIVMYCVAVAGLAVVKLVMRSPAMQWNEVLYGPAITLGCCLVLFAVAVRVRAASEARPRWVTRLGVASIVLGTLGAVAGLARAHQAWRYVFDPSYQTFRLAYPPRPWVSPAHLAAWLALAAAYAILAMAGIISLTKPGAALRLHLWCAALVLALVVPTAILGAMEFLPYRQVSAASLAAGVLMTCATLGAYPAIVVLVVLRRSKSRGVAPAA